MNQEDKKLIYEFSGFYQQEGESYMDYTPYKVWKHPDNPLHDYGYGDLPNILTDHNFYFKYAVPKLNQAQYYLVLKSIFVKQEDPAEAFGQALLKLIKDVKADAKQT